MEDPINALLMLQDGPLRQAIMEKIRPFGRLLVEAHQNRIGTRCACDSAVGPVWVCHIHGHCARVASQDRAWPNPGYEEPLREARKNLLQELIDTCDHWTEESETNPAQSLGCLFRKLLSEDEPGR